MSTVVRLGQFSASPVIAAIHHLGLDARHGLELTTVRVPSSPEQFAMLRDDAIDVAITSPDNVLLYATTDRNPLAMRFDLTLLRPIDHGLGLSLVTRPEIDSKDALATSSLGVDVVRSGFALLLFTMLASFDVDFRTMEFAELGSTPKRMTALIEGRADGTILNAESLVTAREAGMRVWCTSADVCADYLGTVLAVPTGFDADLAGALTGVWQTATDWLLEAPADDVTTCLAKVSTALGSPAYVELLRDPRFGLIRGDAVSLSSLETLVDIRARAGAYTPAPEDVARLARS